MTVLDVDIFVDEMRKFCDDAEIGERDLRFSFRDILSNIQGSDGLRQMTIEDLRKEARKLGYYVYPKIPREKFHPCICGCNRRSHVYNRAHGVTLVCKKCGRHASGYFDKEARENWNEMIKEELKNHDERSAV